MKYSFEVYFCCFLLIFLHKAALADKEDKSDELYEAQDRPETTEGPPDSHEAMNNREINPITKTRQKRSYEFLMGLINNNSRYQVTRDEPAINLSKKQGGADENFGADELLLELMVKIAANPEQWNHVHNILRQIDEDIITSKKVIEKYQNHARNLQELLKKNDVEKENSSLPSKPEERKKKKYTQQEINKEVAITSDNGQPDINAELLLGNTASTSSSKEWPMFHNDDIKVNYLNTQLSSNSLAENTKTENTGSSTTKAYPKYFSYHRVTGKPVFMNRNPKAYIAVSVVAPKSSEIHTDEDLELEHELRQLKPWTHIQNLKNMESIRSRWVINGEKDSNTTV